MARKIFISLSPLVIIAAGFLTALGFSRRLGVWAFIPLVLVYWALCLVLPLLAGKRDIRHLFHPPTGSAAWLIPAVLVGLIPLPIFIFNLHLFHDPAIIILWIAFSFINPFFEELYWRGLLLHALPFRRRWLRAGYSTVFFIASHPLMWGVFSFANRSWMLIISLAVMGVVWSLLRFKTKSLRWCVASHVLVDLLNLSVFAILNLYIPGPPSA